MRNAKDLRTLIENGEISTTELSKEELNALIDEILESFDADNVSETELLDKCYEALETSHEISSERYNKIANEVVESYNKSYAMPPKKKRIIVLIAAAIILLAALGGCRVFDFSVEGLGGWEVLNNIPEQEKVSHGNVDIIWTDDKRKYDSVEELLEKENITDVVLLKNLPDDLKFLYVEYIELGENDRIEFRYECGEIHFFLCIEKNCTYNIVPENFDEVYSAYGIDFCCCLNSVDGQTYAYWNYGKDTYVLQVKAVNEEVLKKALYALEIYSGDEE